MESFLPAELQVVILSMLPLVDIRFSIPYGIAILSLSPATTVALAFPANLLATALVLWCLDPIVKILRKHFKFVENFTNWLFKRTRTKHEKKVSELGHFALFTYVAMPIPGSGFWLGSLIAYVFGLKKRTAIICIGGGSFIASILIAVGIHGLILIF